MPVELAWSTAPDLVVWACAGPGTAAKPAPAAKVLLSWLKKCLREDMRRLSLSGKGDLGVLEAWSVAFTAPLLARNSVKHLANGFQVERYVAGDNVTSSIEH